MSWFKPEVICAMMSYALIILLFLYGRKRAKNVPAKREMGSRKISVIVPFRNEEKNLEALIESLQALSVLPEEIIFVNDHSTDQSLAVLQNLKVPFQLLELDESEGKKSAIAKGVEAASSEFILTWDADVLIPKDYFKTLQKYDFQDLLLLPVKMKGPCFVSGFFAMDYQLQTQANVALAGLYRPITASGANLLFKRKVYLEMANKRTDQDIASGDDQFLLSACRNSGVEIGLLTDKDLTVETDAPTTIQSGLAQRLRWLSKTKHVRDSFATVFGLFTLLVQLSYYTFAFYQSFIGDWGATIVLILIKGELDAFLATYSFQEQFNTLQVFVYQVLYPFYILALLYGWGFYKPTWKNRPI